MVYFESSVITIYYEEDAKCVLMQWKGFAAGDSLKEALNKGLECLVAKKTSRWLADLRKLGVLTKEDQAWSNEDWFPRALAGGVRNMALVMPESVLSNMSVKSIMNKVGEVDLATSYFKTVEEAKAWLKTK